MSMTILLGMYTCFCRELFRAHCALTGSYQADIDVDIDESDLDGSGALLRTAKAAIRTAAAHGGGSDSGRSSGGRSASSRRVGSGANLARGNQRSSAVPSSAASSATQTPATSVDKFDALPAFTAGRAAAPASYGGPANYGNAYGGSGSGRQGSMQV